MLRSLVLRSFLLAACLLALACGGGASDGGFDDVRDAGLDSLGVDVVVEDRGLPEDPGAPDPGPPDLPADDLPEADSTPTDLADLSDLPLPLDDDVMDDAPLLDTDTAEDPIDLWEPLDVDDVDVTDAFEDLEPDMSPADDAGPSDILIPPDAVGCPNKPEPDMPWGFLCETLGEVVWFGPDTIVVCQDPDHDGCPSWSAPMVCPAPDSIAAGHCLCTPSCSGLECGADGCGGRCGTCGEDELCIGHICRSASDYQPGQVLWEVEPFGIGSPRPVAVADDGTIYTSTGDFIYALAEDGSLLWRMETSGSGVWNCSIVAPLMIDDDGSLIAGCSNADRGVLKVSRGGATIWYLRTTENIDDPGAISYSGEISLCEGDELILISNLGEQIWTAPNGCSTSKTPTVISQSLIQSGSRQTSMESGSSNIVQELEGVTRKISSSSGIIAAAYSPSESSEIIRIDLETGETNREGINEFISPPVLTAENFAYGVVRNLGIYIAPPQAPPFIIDGIPSLGVRNLGVLVLSDGSIVAPYVRGTILGGLYHVSKEGVVQWEIQKESGSPSLLAHGVVVSNTGDSLIAIWVGDFVGIGPGWCHPLSDKENRSRAIGMRDP